MLEETRESSTDGLFLIYAVSEPFCVDRLMLHRASEAECGTHRFLRQHVSFKSIRILKFIRKKISSCFCKAVKYETGKRGNLEPRHFTEITKLLYFRIVTSEASLGLLYSYTSLPLVNVQSCDMESYRLYVIIKMGLLERRAMLISIALSTTVL